MTLTQINKAGLDELALDHVFTIGASGTDHYTFQGEGLNGTVNDPTLYLTRGKTYRFENGSGGHPIRIQSTSGASGTAYNTGVTNNAGSGTVIVEVQHDAPDVLYYQCTSHANMNGVLYITGALADGGVTTAKLANDAVTAAKIASQTITGSEIANDAITSALIADNTIQATNIAAGAIGGNQIASNTIGTTNLADDAVTNAKIASDAVGSAEIANSAITTVKLADDVVTADKLASNSVVTASIVNGTITTEDLADYQITTDKIADQGVSLAKLPHGDTNNDGKFLRANNGADPSFETVSIPAGTTINNNADNRVITGSGTANTLEGEQYLNWNGSTLGVQKSGSGDVAVNIEVGNGTSQSRLLFSDSTAVDGTVTYDHNDRKLFLGAGTSSPTDGDITIDSSGNVGIGTTSPNAFSNYTTLTINGGSDGAGIDLELSDNNIYGRLFVDSTGLQIQTSQSGDSIRFETDGSNVRARITDDGLCFGSDSAAANALDDYEEGSWTPNVQQGSVGISSNSSRYVKIGNVCTVSCSFVPSGSGSASASVIFGNLPFQSHSSHAGSTSIMHDGFDESGSPEPTVHAYIGGSTTNFLIYYSRVNGSGWQTARGNEVAGHQMIFNITYPTA